jgi:hypothetical protein
VRFWGIPEGGLKAFKTKVSEADKKGGQSSFYLP